VLARHGTWVVSPWALKVFFVQCGPSEHSANTTAVVWTKSNPTPWNTIKQDEGTKLLSVNQKFDKR